MQANPCYSMWLTLVSSRPRSRVSTLESPPQDNAEPVRTPRDCPDLLPFIMPTSCKASGRMSRRTARIIEFTALPMGPLVLGGLMPNRLATIVAMRGSKTSRDGIVRSSLHRDDCSAVTFASSRLFRACQCGKHQHLLFSFHLTAAQHRQRTFPERSTYRSAAS